MTKIGRVHLACTALLACGVVAFGATSLCASVAVAAAPAAVLAQETGAPSATAGLAVPGEEVVPEVTETTVPVQEAVEAVAAPVAGGAKAAAPPASAPPLPTPGAPPAQVSGTVPKAGSVADAAARQADDVGAAVEEAGGDVVGTDGPQPAATVRSLTHDAGSPAAEALHGIDHTESSPSTPTGLVPSQADAFQPPPTRNGATGAPLPWWVAYVWPAVALTRPYLAVLAGHWARAASHLAAVEFGGSAESADGQGVAGVHASGGNREHSGSSLFSRIPSAIGGGFYSSTTTAALTYLFLAALAVIVLAVVVRREVITGRRERGE